MDMLRLFLDDWDYKFMEDSGDKPQDSRPIPDPTILTTQQLNREISSLNVLVDLRLTALRDIVEEKFSSVGTQLNLEERQRVEQKEDTKAAIDAALTAQKEAVKEQTISSDKAIAKSETGMSELIKGIRSELLTAVKGVDTIAGDLKERVVKLESIKLGQQENRAGIYAAIGSVGLVLLISIAATGLILGSK
jgi:hypothetical protein